MEPQENSAAKAAAAHSSPSWAEPLLDTVRWCRANPLSAALLLASIGVLFWFYCWDRFFVLQTRSAISWLASGWNEENDQQHCWLIFPIALALVWRKWGALRAAEKRPTAFGLALVIVGALLFVASVRVLQPRLAILALPLLLLGSSLFLWGPPVTRIVTFPCVFLLLAIPMGNQIQSTAHLQLVIADIVRILSKLFGIPVAVQGATIESLDGSFARMEVAGGCSGIRSIMAMLMLAALYGYFAHRQWWKQAILFGSAIAFAFLGNLARVFSIVLVAKFIDPKIATTLYHDYSGFIFFPVAVLAMVTMSNTLEMDFGKWFRRWFKPDPVRAGGVGADAAGSGSPGNDQMQPTATTPKTGGISYDY